jgi:SPP1 gp7 family putative phage head morphogenesis protein
MMPIEARYKAIPFQEAIDSFQGKLRLPTRHYTDIMEAEHARAFVVAGAQQDSLLEGFQEAINKALTQGTTLAEFRRDFDRLVQAHGWSHNGTAGWRSRVIFETNLHTSYMTGKWEQMQRVKDVRPYARYVAVRDRRTRPEHAAWNGLIVALDDPWWDTHWPPNGWGCRCSTQSLSERDVAREGWTVSTPPPDDPYTVQLKGPDGPVSVQTVAGVDPGWAYNPGKASSGVRYTDAAKQALEDGGEWGKRKSLTPGDWSSYGRPEVLPERTSSATPAQKAASSEEARWVLENLLGGPEKIFVGADGMAVKVSAAVLAGHHPERSSHYPYIRELLEDPEEIWLSFDEHIATGRVELRKRYVRLLRAGKDKVAQYLVAQVVKGELLAWTLVPLDRASRINRERAGKLLYSRK